MLRTPRTELATRSGYVQNAYQSLTGDPYIPGNQMPGLAWFRQEEYLWSDDGNPRSKSVFKPCWHWKVRRDLQTEKLPSGAIYWSSPGNPAAGTWNYKSFDSPRTDMFWNSFAQSQGLGTPGPSGAYGECFDPIKGLPLLAFQSSTGLQLVPPDALDDLVVRAIRAFTPGIKPAGNISLVNSIIELKDFKSLPHSLNNVKKGLPAIARQLKKLHVLDYGNPLRKLLRMGADGYLQQMFNIAPLLSDIANVKKALSDYRQQLKRLVAESGRPIRKHFQCILEGYNDKQEFDSFNLPSNFVVSTFVWNRVVNYKFRHFNATIDYSYKLPLGSEDNLMGALLDRLGVNFNPKIIWNAIPWSFVIDWVAGVNQWLDQFQTRNIDPVVSIGQFCYSYHVSRSIATGAGLGGTVPCVAYSEEAYQRYVGTPSLYSSLVTSGLSPTEISLGAALALTR